MQGASAPSEPPPPWVEGAAAPSEPPPPSTGCSSSIRTSSTLHRVQYLLHPPQGAAAPSEPSSPLGGGWGGGSVSAPPYLLSVAAVLGHHLPQRLQHLDAEPLLVLLQQLLGVLDQPGGRALSLPSVTDATVHYHCWRSLPPSPFINRHHRSLPTITIRYHYYRTLPPLPFITVNNHSLPPLQSIIYTLPPLPFTTVHFHHSHLLALLSFITIITVHYHHYSTLPFITTISIHYDITIYYHIFPTLLFIITHYHLLTPPITMLTNITIH